MRNLTLSLILLFSISASGQLVNGSFETNGAPDLSGWEFICGPPQSLNDAAPGAGQFCARMAYGNTQGCYPGFLYQKLPTIQDGDVMTLSGWARIDSMWTPTNIGLFIGRLEPGNTIFLENGVQTNNASWTYLTLTDTFHLGPNDTALVVLNTGMVGGPLFGWAHFDGIAFGPPINTNVETIDPIQVQVYPNPVIDALHVAGLDQDVQLRLYDLIGRQHELVEEDHRSGQAQFDTSMLEPGHYLLRASSSDGRPEQVVRFVKR